MSLAHASFAVQAPVRGISLAEAAVRDKSTGAISELESRVATAGYVLENIREYEPRPYPILPGMLKAYADSRLTGGRSYDPAMAKKVVEWNLLLVETHLRNKADLELAKWLVEGTRAVGLMNHTNRLSELIDRHARASYPFEAAALVGAVQYRDASARRESEGAK